MVRGLRNHDFRLTNVDFVLKNVDSLFKQTANGNPRKTPVMAKTLDPIFAKKYQLKLRKLPRRVGDQILRMTVFDFDRLDGDDPLGQLELDTWQVC